MEVNFNKRTHKPGHTPQLPEPYPQIFVNANGKFEDERDPLVELTPEEISLMLRQQMGKPLPHALPAQAPHLFQLLMHGIAPPSQLDRMQCLISCARYLDEPKLLACLVQIFRLSVIELDDPDGHTMSRLAHALPAGYPWLKELRLFTIHIATKADAKAFFGLLKCPAIDLIRMAQWHITAEGADKIHHLGKQAAQSGQVNTVTRTLLIGRPSDITHHTVIGDFLEGVFCAFEMLGQVQLSRMWPSAGPALDAPEVARKAGKCDVSAVHALAHKAHALGDLDIDLSGLPYKVIDALSRLFKGIHKKGAGLHTLSLGGLGMVQRTSHAKRVVSLLSDLATHCPDLRILRLGQIDCIVPTLNLTEFELIGNELGKLIIQGKALTEIDCGMYPIGGGLITGLHMTLESNRQHKPDAKAPVLQVLKIGRVALTTSCARHLLELPMLLPCLQTLVVFDYGALLWVEAPGTEGRIQQLQQSATLEVMDLGPLAQTQRPVKRMQQALQRNKAQRMLQWAHAGTHTQRAGLGLSSDSMPSTQSDSSSDETSTGTSMAGSESGEIRGDEDHHHDAAQ